MSTTKINRIYRHKIVSNLTLSEIEKFIDNEDNNYCGDYGLNFDGKNARLVFSMN